MKRYLLASNKQRIGNWWWHTVSLDYRKYFVVYFKTVIDLKFRNIGPYKFLQCGVLPSWQHTSTSMIDPLINDEHCLLYNNLIYFVLNWPLLYRQFKGYAWWPKIKLIKRFDEQTVILGQTIKYIKSSFITVSMKLTTGHQPRWRW